MGALRLRRGGLVERCRRHTMSVGVELNGGCSLQSSGEQMNVMEGPVAQRLEQGTHNPLVGGSNPSGPTKFKVCILNENNSSYRKSAQTLSLLLHFPSAYGTVSVQYRNAKLYRRRNGCNRSKTLWNLESRQGASSTGRVPNKSSSSIDRTSFAEMITHVIDNIPQFTSA